MGYRVRDREEATSMQKGAVKEGFTETLVTHLIDFPMIYSRRITNPGRLCPVSRMSVPIGW